jgi:hypothetical protein
LTRSFNNLGTGFFACLYADDDYDSNSDGWPKELSVNGFAPTLDITKNPSYRVPHPMAAPAGTYWATHIRLPLIGMRFMQMQLQQM